MPEPEQVWVVMVRDLSHAVRVEDEPVVFAAMVVEVERGLVLGTALAAGPADALARSLHTAATDPPGLAPPGRPAAVYCPPGRAGAIAEALAASFPGEPAPAVREGGPLAGAEDLFDSLVGHLSGRAQPEEAPDPEDWAAAFGAVLAFRHQAPWRRWSDAVPLRVDLATPEGTAAYVATVLGAEGVQHGLALHPGDDVPATEPLRRAPSLEPGTLLVLLDAATELPAELVDKAHRYGWPPDDDLVPVLLSTADGGPADPGRRELDHLALAATAIATHDRRGPVVVGDGDGTEGEVALSEGRRGQFSLRLLRKRGSEAAPRAARPPRPTPPAAGIAEPIDALLAAFLADERARLSERTWRNYDAVVDLLRDCLVGYGHAALDPEELRRFEAAYEHDEEAFVHLFGAQQIADNLDTFLGEFMVAKVLAGPELLRAAGTVTGRLARWLGEQGALDEATARDASRRARAAVRDLPNADRLATLLHEHAQRCATATAGAADEEVVDDLLVIEQVEDGALFFDAGVGPVEVPAAASALARVGWSVSGCAVRRGGRWHLVGIGNVYPS